jgi:hypothetical protein
MFYVAQVLAVQLVLWGPIFSSGFFMSPITTSHQHQHKHQYQHQYQQHHQYQQLQQLQQTDNSFQEYSRSLTPREERDQINSELALSKIPTWKRIPKKIVRKVIRKVSRVKFGLGGGSDVNPGPGTLLLVRGGESEFSTNYTFTG